MRNKLLSTKTKLLSTTTKLLVTTALVFTLAGQIKAEPTQSTFEMPYETQQLAFDQETEQAYVCYGPYDCKIIADPSFTITADTVTAAQAATVGAPISPEAYLNDPFVPTHDLAGNIVNGALAGAGTQAMNIVSGHGAEPQAMNTVSGHGAEPQAMNTVSGYGDEPQTMSTALGYDDALRNLQEAQRQHIAANDLYNMTIEGNADPQITNDTLGRLRTAGQNLEEAQSQYEAAIAATKTADSFNAGVYDNNASDYGDNNDYANNADYDGNGPNTSNNGGGGSANATNTNGNSNNDIATQAAVDTATAGFGAVNAVINALK